MLVKPGDTVRFLGFFQDSTGAGVSGLTVTVAVNEGTTNRVSVASATAATQLDATNQPGWYYYDHVVTAAFYGIVAATFRTSSTSVASIRQPSLYISANWIERIDTTVSSRLASASYTAPDNTGIDTLEARLTAQRATNLDNLDATISSRLATSGYTAPPSTADIWAYPTRTLTSFGTLVADIWSYVTRTLTSGGGSSVADIVAGVWNALLASYTQTGSMGAAMNRIAAGLGYVIQSVSQDGGTVTLIQRDDYLVANGDPLIWNIPSGVTWPDLTNADKVTLGLKSRNRTVQVDAVVATNTQLKFELTSAQTATLPVNIGDSGNFEIQVVKNGLKKTFIRGTLIVLFDIAE